MWCDCVCVMRKSHCEYVSKQIDYNKGTGTCPEGLGAAAIRSRLSIGNWGSMLRMRAPRCASYTATLPSHEPIINCNTYSKIVKKHKVRSSTILSSIQHNLFKFFNSGRQMIASFVINSVKWIKNNYLLCTSICGSTQYSPRSEVVIFQMRNLPHSGI